MKKFLMIVWLVFVSLLLQGCSLIDLFRILHRGIR